MDTKIEYETVTDNAPVIEKQKQPYNPGFLTKKFQYGAIKFGIWLILSLAIFFTGFGTKLSDLAYERGYPITTLIWGGFALAIYLLYSAITFYFDWKLENDIAFGFGIHSMPPVNIIGRWLRKTLVDAIGFFFISMLVLTVFFFPIIYSNFKPGAEQSPAWWIWAGLVSIILIPLYITIRRALLLMLGNMVSRITSDSGNESKTLLVIFGILNIVSMFFFWNTFSYIGMFSDKLNGVANTIFAIVITGSWAILTIMSLLGRFANRSSQIQVVYLIGTVLLTSWIYFYTIGLFAMSTNTLHWRFIFFAIAAFLIMVMIIDLVSIFRIKYTDESKITTISNICKKFSIIPLGYHYYGLQGDSQAETKLFGFFGLYYIFIPENLENTEEEYASITHALARHKNNNGLALTIVRVILFTLFAICSWFVFDMSYGSSRFMWFSNITGDPLLVLVILMLLGFFFGFVGKPLVNMVARAVDRYSRKVTATFVKPEVYESYITKLEQATGEYGNTDKIAQLYFADSHQAD